MDPTRETLSAFIDGELPPKEMERIAALLATRPDLDAWVRQQETLRAGMKSALSDLAAAPPPERLVRIAQTTPISWRWRLGRAGQGAILRTWIPAGATLALGLLIGIGLVPPGDIGSRGGQVVAQGALASALNGKLASDNGAGSGPRIGVSFRDHDGRYCRSFDADGQSGFACHGSRGWDIAMLAARPNAEASGPYRMAGSEMPDAIRAAIAARIQGEPFDIKAEKAARDRGWQ
ncbi:MAG: hypothetical protein J0I19_04755 [Alphaproteobacteria bacterium]|nr:hypothetical protein [Alphaproteobacteria bacterium]